MHGSKMREREQSNHQMAMVSTTGSGCAQQRREIKEFTTTTILPLRLCFLMDCLHVHT